MEQVSEVLPQLVALNEIGNLEVGWSAFPIHAEIECAPSGGLANDGHNSPENVESICVIHDGEGSYSSRFPGIGKLRASVRRQLSDKNQRAEADKCDSDKRRQEILCGCAEMIPRPS